MRNQAGGVRTPVDACIYRGYDNSRFCAWYNRQRGEEGRSSYLVIGFMLGIAILQPVGICSYTVSAMCGLGLAFVFEIDSIMEHICIIHGIKNRISIKRILVGYIKKKYNTAGELIEEVTKENKEEMK